MPGCIVAGLGATFMVCAEERVQLLKETEEGKLLRCRIGRECCPRKERNFEAAESGQFGLTWQDRARWGAGWGG